MRVGLICIIFFICSFRSHAQGTEWFKLLNTDTAIESDAELHAHINSIYITSLKTEYNLAGFPSSRKINIIKLNPSGEVIWNNNFIVGNSTNYLFIDIEYTEINSSRILVKGLITHDSVNKDFFILLVDTLGNKVNDSIIPHSFFKYYLQHQIKANTINALSTVDGHTDPCNCVVLEKRNLDYKLLAIDSISAEGFSNFKLFNDNLYSFSVSKNLNLNKIVTTTHKYNIYTKILTQETDTTEINAGTPLNNGFIKYTHIEPSYNKGFLLSGRYPTIYKNNGGQTMNNLFIIRLDSNGKYINSYINISDETNAYDTRTSETIYFTEDDTTLISTCNIRLKTGQIARLLSAYEQNGKPKWSLYVPNIPNSNSLLGLYFIHKHVVIISSGYTFQEFSKNGFYLRNSQDVFDTGTSFSSQTNIISLSNHIYIGADTHTYNDTIFSIAIKKYGLSFLSTEFERKEKITIYPNPSSGLIHIPANKSFKEKARIIDMYGKSSTVDIINHIIKLDNFSAGYYILELQEQETKTIYRQKILLTN